jgi:molybdopterin converting factor small subunit
LARYTVKLFGPQARLAQQREVEVEVAGDSTQAREVLAAVGAACPALGESLASSRLAVNHAFAPGDTPVRPGDEVALIGMLGGG